MIRLDTVAVPVHDSNPVTGIPLRARPTPGANVKSVSVLDVLAFLWSHWRRLPIRFALVVTGAATAVVLEVLIPDRTAALMTAVEQAAQGAAPIDRAWEALIGLVAIYLLLMAAQQFYLRVWMFFTSAVMQRIVLEGFEKVQRFSTDWHTNQFAGSTVRRISRGMWAYDSLADTIVIDLGPPLVLLGGFSIAMFQRQPLLGAFFGLSVLVFLGVSFGLSLLYVAPANVASNEADTAVGGALSDAVTCNTVVKSFGAEWREDERLEAVTGTWRRNALRAWTRAVDAGAIQSLALTAMIAGMLAIVLGLAQAGRASLGDIVYVLTTFFLVRGYLRNIGWQIRNFQRAVNEIDDLVEISGTPLQVADVPDARPFEPGLGRIEFEGVGFRYRNQPEDTFDGLDITIEAGEKVALVGPSGAGKTTFVKLLQRLHDLDRGTIRIDGQDIALCEQESLRRGMALVPQEPILFHRSLAENISYGRPGCSRKEIEEAARQAHAHEFISRLDAGYETLVGERGIRLSGGERQRVAIARALLTDAPILILDEATSSLDSLAEQLIQQAIGELLEGRTAVLIAHRLSTVRRADRILVFDRGRIVEQGSHEELMSQPEGSYRRMFDMQTLGFVDDLGARAEAG